MQRFYCVCALVFLFLGGRDLVLKNILLFGRSKGMEKALALTIWKCHCVSMKSHSARAGTLGATFGPGAQTQQRHKIPSPARPQTGGVCAAGGPRPDASWERVGQSTEMGSPKACWRPGNQSSEEKNKMKGIGCVSLINKRHQFLENMEENHINEISYLIGSYLIFIPPTPPTPPPPWDRIKTRPSLAIVGADSMLFSSCSSRASKDADHLLVSRELLLRLTFSCQRHSLLPCHCRDAASHSSGEITDFTFSLGATS